MATIINNIKLGKDILRLYQTEDGAIDAYIITADGDSTHVFKIEHREHKFMGHDIVRNEIGIAFDFDDETALIKRNLLYPKDRPNIVMKNGKLYCRKCHCWVPNTANEEMKKEGCYAYSHICGIKAPGEVYEDTTKPQK